MGLSVLTKSAGEEAPVARMSLGASCSGSVQNTQIACKQLDDADGHIGRMQGCMHYADVRQ